MRLWSHSFRDGGLLSERQAACVLDDIGQTCPGANLNPHLAWNEVAGGCRSLVLTCHDGDAPRDRGAALDGANPDHATRLLPVYAPRTTFFHWIVLDLPPAPADIGEGKLSRTLAPAASGVAPGAQVRLRGPGGNSLMLRQGVNDAGKGFAGDRHVAGDYYGYDGPCPPSNDERIHHYIFRLYALDVARLHLDQRFTGPQARAAMHGHIVDEAQLVGAYSLNPALAPTLTR